MSYLSVGEKHGIQGGENAGGEKVSGGRKCVSRKFDNFCGLLRKYELYYAMKESVGKDRLFLDLQLTAEDTNLANHMICQLLSLQLISLILRQQL